MPTSSPTTYRVDGMTCGGCARSLTRAVETALPGLPVQVDLAQGTLTASGPHDPSALRQAVEAAGYTWVSR